MLQKTISGMAGFRCIKRIPIKKLHLLLPILTFTGFNAFGQFNYEKRFEKQTFSLNIATHHGPFLLSLKDNNKGTIDTLAYHDDVFGGGYVVYDVYLDNNFLAFAHTQTWMNASIECAFLENGKWDFPKYWPELVSPEEVLQPHEIKIIDRNYIRVTKGGKSYIHTIDYKERKHTVAEEIK